MAGTFCKNERDELQVRRALAQIGRSFVQGMPQQVQPIENVRFDAHFEGSGILAPDGVERHLVLTEEMGGEIVDPAHERAEFRRRHCLKETTRCTKPCLTQCESTFECRGNARRHMATSRACLMTRLPRHHPSDQNSALRPLPRLAWRSLRVERVMGIEPITHPCWIRSLGCVVTRSATEVRNFAVRGAAYGKVRQLVQVLPKDRYRPTVDLRTPHKAVIESNESGRLERCLE